MTSQSGGKCFLHKPGPSASRARLPSASPPPSVTGKHWRNDSSYAPSGIHLRMSDPCRLNRLTSVAVIPTLSPALNAKSKFSFCESILTQFQYRIQEPNEMNPFLTHIVLLIITFEKKKPINLFVFHLLFLKKNRHNTLCSGLSESYGMSAGRNV